ncbi:MAG: outer membrane protein assembly factor BamA [Proteobacteria bacterium]|nr:outer membrane protein assembly factor BamA [Pseudomonadota bacterium]
MYSKSLRKFSLVFLLLIGRATALLGAESVVSKVEVVGNRKIEAAAIKQKLHTQVGATLNKQLVREDIRALFALGFFEDISVVQQDTEQGLKIVFKVKEKPTILKIDYEGLDAIEKDDLKDLVLVKEYELLNRQKLNESVEKIVQKYEEKGFYLADVRYEVTPMPNSTDVQVTFKAKENDKITVRKINIIGNKVIPTDELKAIMQTKEGGVFSWMTGSGSYREVVFERDIAALGFYYGTQGYVRARFGKPEVTVSPDKKWIYITFFVEEGLQYTVGNVDFSGELLFNRAELNENMELISGDTFNTEILRRDTLRLTEKYGDLGYAFANVVPQPIIHDDTRQVDITFDVDRGQRVYIGKIEVTSNTKTKDKVVRRELTIHEGELFNGTKKRESKENVTRLGYFDSVEFHQTTSKEDPNVVDIDIKVKERSTGQLVIGAGYSTGGVGFIANAQLSQNNFLGNGQVASFSAQIQTGTKLYEYSLSFQEPYYGATLWSAGGDLYQVRRNVAVLEAVNSFEEIKTGSAVKLGHPVYNFMNMFLTYKFEHAYVRPSSIIDKTLYPKEDVNGYTSSVAGNLVYDKRDDRFDPRDGFFGSITSEYAGLGGDRYFLKSTATAKYFHPIIWDFVFRFHLTGSNIARTGSRRVPNNELYLMGGLFSLRGYDPFSIGGDPVTLSNNPDDLSEEAKKAGLAGKKILIGGLNQVLMNAEIEFPLLKEARIRGVIFADVGNAFNDFSKITGPKLYANLGWGFRWFTPIGPLRFEFGYPMVNSGASKFFFTIGPPF